MTAEGPTAGEAPTRGAVLAPAGAHEALGLASYLRRLTALDSRAAVRIQARGAVAGVFAGPPFEVVSLRPVALAAPVDVDATVSAQRLLERLDAVAPGEAITLPPPVVGPAWAGLLPPRTGWAPAGEVAAVAVAAAVRSGIVSFREKADRLPEAERTVDRLDAMAREVWRTPIVGSVPLRAAHAAEALGLLGREGDVTSSTSGPWRRLRCAGGSVAVRDLDVPGLALLFS